MKIINIILGIWLVVSPWILGFSDSAAATWNAIILGILVVVLAVVVGGEKKTGGGAA